MALFKRTSEPATKPGATFFDDAAHEDTSANTKPVKARKTRGKESSAVEAVDQREPLQQTIERPRENLMRMLQRAETGQRGEQPTSATRSEAFRRPSMYNSLGLRSNGPINFSTHPNEYDDLYARSIAAEKAEARDTQNRRAWAGVEFLARLLTPAKRKGA
ncbi:hypothetical protein R69619_03322 [Paraburkholderia nemoris]|uniref:hypothetical protein n=1 Tax=Paraburkholderia nemoris TaxID=2793076 RepID=UPI00190C9F16|nr:hypothetical protein [Paraburkholderia nemoris]MBK3743340.1 hypothetical protein [Paraburkholderia aspalathi]CAE6759849.1 hypothetical protein R69619_03322 [Paraburkholderia nemoris]